jgi:hypothetical protein
MYPEDHGVTFVQHVAILQNDMQLSYAMKRVLVWQMCPPLVVGAQSATTAVRIATATGISPDEYLHCTAHLVAGLQLDADDLEGIKTWLAEVDKESRPTTPLFQYYVDPPMKWAEGENKVRLFRKFSCAGLVLECYRSVGIDLLVQDSLRLPEIDLATVVSIYGPDMTAEAVRRRIGIPGNGPWRVVLAGYVIHALNRPDDVVRRSPHCPSSSEERYFPLPPVVPSTE